ncbi:hypothetical protein TKK_0004838 [Trichogramma kaykai]|uniref:SOCS box domain-containing protein n=1 Tax=Trichogramma kaykai TaxID=54128 RepID=A0ABD2XK73_9HYME
MEALMTPIEKEQFLRQDDYFFNKRLSRSSSCPLVCSDEVCLTRFHRACEDGRLDLVGQFLEFCQDPDCQVLETGDSPLHLTLYHDHKSLTELLLSRGAHPNLTNSIGWTPLHALGNRDGDDKDDTTRTFFKIAAQRGRVVAVDARDDLGRTPLDCAVANLQPNVVDALLENGADLAGFRFPSEVYFNERLRRSAGESRLEFVLRVAAGMMAVVERLKRHGYPFDQTTALFMLKLSGLYTLFNAPPDADEGWYEDERFQRVAKTIAITDGDPRLTLHVLLFMRSEDAAKLVSYEEYSRLTRSPGYAELPEECRTACTKHLCSKLTRKFFLDWSKECLMRVAPPEMSHDLKLELCEQMLTPLRNAVLYHVCLAAERGLLHELAMFDEMKIDLRKLDSLFSRNKIVQD